MSPIEPRPDELHITGDRPGTVPPPGGITTEPPLGEPVYFEPPKKPHPGFWWSVLWCFGFLLVTQVPGALVAAIILIAAQWGSPPGTGTLKEIQSLAFAVAFLITEALVIGVSWIVIRLVVGRDWTRQLALRTPSPWHVGLAIVSLPGLIVIANIFYVWLKRQMGDMSELGLPNLEEAMKVMESWPWPLAVLIIGLGPGIGEELWCRGFLGRGLVGRYGVVLGVLFTSFFFGAIHVLPAQGTMAVLMGIYLHFTYLVTRSLWVPILLHFLNNSFAVISPHIEAFERFDSEVIKAPVHLVGAAVFLVAAVSWALYDSRARLRALDGEAVFWSPAYEGVEYPPARSGVVVVRPAPSALALLLTGVAIAAFATSFYYLWTAIPGK
jgi:membrane protease YdiL (CAAX protease family)